MSFADSTMKRESMKIVIDSREQAPFNFAGERYSDIEICRGTLPTGDYSLAGLVDCLAIERKSLADLVHCLGNERERFERELQRAQGLEFFGVVVEASFEQLAKGEYRSRINPHAACQSVMAFMARYRTPFLFAGSKAAAEFCTWSLLRQYLQGKMKRLDALIKAHQLEGNNQR